MITTDLKGKTAIVTGAGRGIGRTLAYRLAECGAAVVLAARTEAELEITRRGAVGRGGRALAVKTDISREGDVVRLVETAVTEFEKVDILINNAGCGRAIPIPETTAEEWDAVFGVNAKGTFLCSREVMRRMVKDRIRGTIITIASSTGKKGYVHQSAYCASKFAAVGFTKVLAMECQPHGIRVHTICPGGVNTEMIRSIRPDIEPSTLIQPDDIADAVLYLLSLREEIAIDEVMLRRFSSPIQ